jgi:hypothetical protein
MRPMNARTFAKRAPLLVAALCCAMPMPTASAQLTTERTPDVSNKALITKEAPPLKDAPKKGRRGEAVLDRAIHGDDEGRRRLVLAR